MGTIVTYSELCHVKAQPTLDQRKSTNILGSSKDFIMIVPLPGQLALSPTPPVK